MKRTQKDTKTRMLFLSDELKRRAMFRAHLGHGDIKIISSMAGVSKHVVSRYLKGEYKNSRVGAYVSRHKEIIMLKVEEELRKKEYGKVFNEVSEQ